jgi:1,2-diacylglycerol 3-alpha-glucosyltransferase
MEIYSTNKYFPIIRMKIGFFNHTLRMGSGIDTVITELATRLAKTDEVEIICFKSDYEKEKYDFKITEINSHLLSNQFTTFSIAPFILDKLAKTKILETFDVVNTHNFPCNYIAKNLKKPIHIVTEWSVGDPSLWRSSLKQRIYVKYLVYRGNRIAAKKANILLASSHFIEKWVQTHYGIDPLVMQLDGINFSLLDKNKVDCKKLFSQYPKIENKRIISFVGRVTDHKNIHSLIMVFDLIAKEYDDVILMIIGDYKNYYGYYLSLLDLINSKNLVDKVIFTGVVPWEDLPLYYSVSSVYATCTLWEGFLRPEAFAFEKPIVCFDTGPNSETVINGQSGFLVPNGDIRQFANRIIQLLENDSLAHKMGETGYNWAKENLDFDIIAENFRNLCYQKLENK